MTSSESPKIATLVLRVTAVTCSPRTWPRRSRLRTSTGIKITASVTITAAALIPAILMRNGTPVAARSDDVVTVWMGAEADLEAKGEAGSTAMRAGMRGELRHSTLDYGEALLSDQSFEVAHGERRFDGECVRNPGSGRRGADPGDRGALRCGIRGLVEASSRSEGAHRHRPRQQGVGTNVPPGGHRRTAISRLRHHRYRAHDDADLPARGGAPPCRRRSHDLGESQPDRVERPQVHRVIGPLSRSERGRRDAVARGAGDPTRYLGPTWRGDTG